MTNPTIELSVVSRYKRFKTPDIVRNPGNYFEPNVNLIDVAFDKQNGVVARVNGRVIGFAFFYPLHFEHNPDARGIKGQRPVDISIHQHLWVHPSWRAMKVGQYLLEFAVLLNVAKVRDTLPGIITTAKFGNEAARAAQGRAGFVHFDQEFERGSDRHLAAANHALSTVYVGQYSLSAYDIRRVLPTADWSTVAHSRGIDFDKFVLRVVDKTDGRSLIMPAIQSLAAREPAAIARLNIAENEDESTVFHTRIRETEHPVIVLDGAAGL